VIIIQFDLHLEKDGKITATPPLAAVKNKAKR
jgi:hypothetical protein